MLSIMIPSRHKIGDTVDVKINGEPAKLTWADARTLVINGTDRRRIFMHREDMPDGAGKLCHSFVAGDAQADIASGEAPDSVTVITPETVHVFRQSKD
jgi:hypothetical protein